MNFTCPGIRATKAGWPSKLAKKSHLNLFFTGLLLTSLLGTSLAQAFNLRVNLSNLGTQIRQHPIATGLVCLGGLAAGLFGYCYYETSKFMDLKRAIRTNNIPEVKRLLAKGVLLELTTTYSSRTILMEAAIQNRAEIIPLLVAAGAKLNAQDQLGATALLWAIESNCPDAALALIAAGADVNIAERSYGESPLLWLVHFDRRDAANLQVAAKLIAAGAKVPTDLAQHPLILAALKAQPAVPASLIDPVTTPEANPENNPVKYEELANVQL